MSKYKIGYVVVPHEFYGSMGGIMLLPEMKKHINITTSVIGTFGILRKLSNGWFWPESALTPYKPEENTGAEERASIKELIGPKEYDLKEFVLAALTGLCANSHELITEEIGGRAVKIAKSTLEALINELNKEA